MPYVLFNRKLIGRDVQNSALWTLKRKLMLNPDVIALDRLFPSTKMCPRLGIINEDITLSDRIFTCGCGYAEDRDVKTTNSRF